MPAALGAGLHDVGRLLAGAVAVRGAAKMAARVAEMESRGHRAYEYAVGGNAWVFLVNAEDGHAEYHMWSALAHPSGAVAGASWD